MSSYFTIESVFKSELEVKDSKFIGLLYPINSKEEFEKNLDLLWKEHPKARHICYAYIIDEKNFHYYDDGEPSGTAGIRIYTALKIKKLERCALFVVRYFGGTKLGTGPLAKAYFDVSMNVINSAKIVEKFLTKEVNLILDYSEFERLKNFLIEYSVYEPLINYTDKINIKLFIEVEKVKSFFELLRELLPHDKLEINLRMNEER
jgi:uncharacterized YigZ family protein